MKTAKAQRLLRKSFTEEEAKGFRDRHLNDTRYIARYLREYLQTYMKFDETKAIKDRVQVRSGSLTSLLRHRWGFPEKDRKEDRHHALDALIVACATQSMVHDLAVYFSDRERQQEIRVKKPFPVPWDSFREDAIRHVYGKDGKGGKGGIFVTRMPVRKVTGAAHQDTIRSIRAVCEDRNGQERIVRKNKTAHENIKRECITQKVKLQDFKKATKGKPATVEMIVEKDTRNKKLYEVLKVRLAQYDDDAKKAFAEPIYMPTNDPAKQGPRIFSVNVVTKEKSGIEINKGLASNGDRVRVDVFKKEGKYHLVPIYVHHFAGKTLPNRAIVSKKDESEWTEMQDKDFLFSLHKNEFVKIVTKKKTIEGYYNGAHRGTAAITLRAHDSDPNFGKDGIRGGIGVKTALTFEKYTVDYFGNKFKVNKEKRCGVADSDNP